jgi:hypothetical protein
MPNLKYGSLQISGVRYGPPSSSMHPPLEYGLPQQRAYAYGSPRPLPLEPTSFPGFTSPNYEPRDPTTRVSTLQHQAWERRKTNAPSLPPQGWMEDSRERGILPEHPRSVPAVTYGIPRAPSRHPPSGNYGPPAPVPAIMKPMPYQFLYEGQCNLSQQDYSFTCRFIVQSEHCLKVSPIDCKTHRHIRDVGLTQKF